MTPAPSGATRSSSSSTSSATFNQPLHTVGELRGYNDLAVCYFSSPAKNDSVAPTNLHIVWDVGLIRSIFWDWGGYVDYLETELAPRPQRRWRSTPERRSTGRSRRTRRRAASRSQASRWTRASGPIISRPSARPSIASWPWQGFAWRER